jgi:hypothetical protein
MNITSDRAILPGHELLGIKRILVCAREVVANAPWRMTVLSEAF